MAALAAACVLGFVLVSALSVDPNEQLLLDLPQGASFGWRTLTSVVGLDKLFQQNYAEPDETSVVDEPHRSCDVTSGRILTVESRIGGGWARRGVR